MENVTRKNKRRTDLEAGVKLDSSATHFKNSKLSENLEFTLDTLFRKKNLARISQRHLVSKTRKDFEYLQALKQVIKLEQGKHKYGPSTSASSKRQPVITKTDNSPATTNQQLLIQPDMGSKKIGFGSSSKHSFIIRKPSTSDSSSSESFSDLSESDGENDETVFSVDHRKHGRFGRQTRRSTSTTNPGYLKKQIIPETGHQYFSGSRHGTGIRHTGKVLPTKGEFTLPNFVYDPGDVYLVPPRKKHQPMFPPKKKRPKTVFGFPSISTRGDNVDGTVISRQSQSAGLSRRKLRDMNNIDALIESSETPIFMDCKQVLLENNKQYFKGLQSRVDSFLIEIEDFKNRSAQKTDMTLFFLNL